MVGFFLEDKDVDMRILVTIGILIDRLVGKSIGRMFVDRSTMFREEFRCIDWSSMLINVRLRDKFLVSIRIELFDRANVHFVNIYRWKIDLSIGCVDPIDLLNKWQFVVERLDRDRWANAIDRSMLANWNYYLNERMSMNQLSEFDCRIFEFVLVRKGSKEHRIDPFDPMFDRDEIDVRDTNNHLAHNPDQTMCIIEYLSNDIRYHF